MCALYERKLGLSREPLGGGPSGEGTRLAAQHISSPLGQRVRLLLNTAQASGRRPLRSRPCHAPVSQLCVLAGLVLQSKYSCYDFRISLYLSISLFSHNSETKFLFRLFKMMLKQRYVSVADFKSRQQTIVLFFAQNWHMPMGPLKFQENT